MEAKECRGCLAILPNTEEFFRKNYDKNRGKHYLRNKCKTCHNSDMRDHFNKNRKKNLLRASSNQLKKSYGISLEEYNLMLDKQGRCCAICGQHESVFSRRLAVDHNHSTGDIRGLLCGPCNSAIGQLKEDRKLFLKAIEYLESYDS